MNEIVRVVEAEFNGELIPACDARELHEFLEVRTRFNDWVSRRIQDAQLVEGRDFTAQTVSEPILKTEYTLSLDAGKHIAMLERNDKGKAVREYFIEYEKRHRSGAIVPKSSAEIALYMAQALVDQERRQREIETRQVQAEDRIQRIEARQEAVEKGISYFSIIAYARYKSFGPVELGMARRLGYLATQACKAAGFRIGHVRDPRFGQVNTYPEIVLDDVFATAIS